MRTGNGRWLFFACVAAPAFAMLAGAAPPTVAPAPIPVDKAESEPTAAERREKLQADILKLLQRLGDSQPTPTAPLPVPKPKVDVTPGVLVDEIRAGMNRFRDNDIETAKRTFQLIDPTALGNEDRAFVRYMLACCHRKLGNLGEAETIYREVANSPDDEFLANCAIWQLSLIRSEKELQSQLEQLRSRAKSK